MWIFIVNSKDWILSILYRGEGEEEEEWRENAWEETEEEKERWKESCRERGDDSIFYGFDGDRPNRIGVKYPKALSNKFDYLQRQQCPSNFSSNWRVNRDKIVM